MMNKPDELAAIPHPSGEQPETVAKRLSKGRCLLAADVMEGFKFAKTNKIPEDLFDNEEFIANPEKFYYKSNEKNNG